MAKRSLILAGGVFDDHMLRLPAGLGRYRTRILERAEERMADEGIPVFARLAGAGIPIRSRHLIDAGDDLRH